jgi:16S rRNA (adenine1518-N6/adenine1519-N6)-dimethyltransferase
VYGAPSAILQLACEVRLLRTVDRAVFTPRPRVDSALIALRRTGPAPNAEVRRLVHDAFAHRRKSMARSLEHARPGSRETVREALVELGLPADARAEQLAPEQFVALAEAMR